VTVKEGRRWRGNGAGGRGVVVKRKQAGWRCFWVASRELVGIGAHAQGTGDCAWAEHSGVGGEVRMRARGWELLVVVDRASGTKRRG